MLVSYLVVDRHEQSDLTAGPAVDHAARFPRALFDRFVPPVTPSGKPIQRTHDLGEHDAHGVATAAVARGHIVHPSVDAFTAQLAHRHDLRLIPIRDLPAMPIGPIWITARQNARIRALADTAANLPPPADEGRPGDRSAR